MGDDLADDQSAQTHAEFIKGQLKTYYGKDLDEENFVVIVVADNTNTNPVIARLLKAVFIGCGAHRHALEMKYYVNDQYLVKRAIKTCKYLMLAAKIPNAMAWFFGKTDRKPYIFGDTKWRGKYLCVKRAVELHDLCKQNPHIDRVHYILEDTQVYRESRGQGSMRDDTDFTKPLIGRRASMTEVDTTTKVLMAQDMICREIQSLDNQKLCVNRGLLEEAAALLETAHEQYEGLDEYR